MKDFELFRGENHCCTISPECESRIQIKGLYSSDRKYNTIHFPKSVQDNYVSKDVSKEVINPKHVEIYNTIRDNFDLAVAFAIKYLGFHITDNKAKECLEIYYASQGWLYPHSTVNNIPFILFYLQPAFNPYGLLIKKDSELEKTILKTKDLKLEQISGNKYYNKLLPNSQEYMTLTMMIWHHKFKEDENGSLKESINIEISKDITENPDKHKWQKLLDKKIMIPEQEFVKFINSNKTNRNKDLQDFAHQLMPPLQ